MSMPEILTFLNHYGLLFLFLVVFLEYMNVPGFPAGVIFPLAGAWVAGSGESFLLALGVSVMAGLLGSLILYGVGRKGGRALLRWLRGKRPTATARLDKYAEKMARHANSTVFFAKLLPVVRTWIGIPAGIIGMDLRAYLLFSGLGILIWNTVFMVTGMVLGDAVLN